MDEVRNDVAQMEKAFRFDRHGTKYTFLQDADSLILPTEKLVMIIADIREKFPNIDRVTTYAQTQTMNRKNVSDYKQL